MALELSGQPPIGPFLRFLLLLLQRQLSLIQVQMQQSFPWSGATQGQRRLSERCLFKMHKVAGREIPTSGLRDLEIVLKTQEGSLAILKERVTFSFSAEIAQPSLCFGKMMQSGWGIDEVEQCLVNGDIRIPVELQNQCVVVQGQIRKISDLEPMAKPKVRVLKVKLSVELSYTQEKQSGWKRERENLWRGVHLGHHYQDPAYVPGLDQEVEWQRTTLVLKDD